MEIIKKINKGEIILRYVLIFFAIIMLGCKHESINKKIAGTGYKLWQKVDNEEQIRGTTTYYYFGLDGDFKYYKKYLKSTKIEELDMGDVVNIETWKILEENKIQISKKLYNIKNLNDTSFVYSSDSPSVKDIRLIYKGDRLQ